MPRRSRAGPRSFAPDRLHTLASYVARWPAHVGLGVELRHPDWYGTEGAAQAWDHFEAHGVVAIVTDVAGRRDVLHMRLTARTAIVRLVGTGESSIDEPRADAWAERLTAWSRLGLEEAYVFLHQPEEHRNVPLARRLARRLATAGLPVREPSSATLIP